MSEQRRKGDLEILSLFWKVQTLAKISWGGYVDILNIYQREVNQYKWRKNRNQQPAINLGWFFDPFLLSHPLKSLILDFALF